jgi:hypothetical protein
MVTAAVRPLKVGLQVPHWEGGLGGITPRWADLLALAQAVSALLATLGEAGWRLVGREPSWFSHRLRRPVP